jgi:hypothetical protein
MIYGKICDEGNMASERMRWSKRIASLTKGVISGWIYENCKAGRQKSEAATL